MRALTVWRPWAWALFHGKPVENRTWSAPGAIGETVAIHAGGTWDQAGAEFVCRTLGLTRLPRESADLGIIGVATLDRVIAARDYVFLVRGAELEPLLSSPWFVGPQGWVFTDHAELECPVACRGAQRLWTVPEALAELVVERVESRRRR